MIELTNASAYRNLDEQGLQEIAQSVWNTYSTERCEIAVNFVSRSHIIELNKAYFEKSTPTDVIAFHLGKGPEQQIIADIYICPEIARENARRFRCDFSAELARLVIHGILHLLGFDDQTIDQKQEMRKIEERFLERYSTC